MKRKLIVIATILAVLVACSKMEEETPKENPGETPTGVSFITEELPYSKLSDYRFFEGDLSDLSPTDGVLPYELITPLFTDYAKKSRFVWMAEGASAQYDGDTEIFSFDDGTVLIKNFYYNNVQPSNEKRIIETRLLYKVQSEWFFADYVWNDEQTEAYFDLNGSYTDIEFYDEENDVLRSIEYRIPSDGECLTCHKSNSLPIPIGPKPQNMNMVMDYENGSLNQLDMWQSVGYLSGNLPGEIETVADWQDENALLSERVRAYVDINCGHCHREGSHCDYRPVRFAWAESNVDENIGICVEPDEFINETLTHIIAPGNHERSMMYYRLNTTYEAERMPLLGRSVIHEEATELIKEYINSLTEDC
jgi:uncharacterized repeat protein (TIGR03806 family)